MPRESKKYVLPYYGKINSYVPEPRFGVHFRILGHEQFTMNFHLMLSKMDHPISNFMTDHFRRASIFIGQLQKWPISNGTILDAQKSWVDTANRSDTGADLHRIRSLQFIRTEYKLATFRNFLNGFHHGFKT